MWCFLIDSVPPCTQTCQTLHSNDQPVSPSQPPAEMPHSAVLHQRDWDTVLDLVVAEHRHAGWLRGGSAMRTGSSTTGT
ncbi:hypothetical protein B0H10DRAFT_2000944 [Mycena sp. CBHHK59/15]|nr:hypothetical protein B0H10DRAFT_2000944 [Mycena sp. CBHHK59/15]